MSKGQKKVNIFSGKNIQLYSNDLWESYDRDQNHSIKHKNNLKLLTLIVIQFVPSVLPKAEHETCMLIQLLVGHTTLHKFYNELKIWGVASYLSTVDNSRSCPQSVHYSLFMYNVMVFASIPFMCVSYTIAHSCRVMWTVSTKAGWRAIPTGGSQWPLAMDYSESLSTLAPVSQAKTLLSPFSWVERDSGNCV